MTNMPFTSLHPLFINGDAAYVFTRLDYINILLEILSKRKGLENLCLGNNAVGRSEQSDTFDNSK